jgi:SAM-dependent methyltransferase
MKNNNEISPKTYNYDYYERGLVCNVSGYMNYGWMPEMTLHMAHNFILNLGISKNHKVLDYGCAKGYLVKAFRILDIEAYGVDVSDYAISLVDTEIKDYCALIETGKNLNSFNLSYDFVIAKDVLEHITEDGVKDILNQLKKITKKIFIAVPLASDNDSGKYIIGEYDNDITHVLAKTFDWWTELFLQAGWNIDLKEYEYPGCKENWTTSIKNGNAFFVLSNKIC